MHAWSRLFEWTSYRLRQRVPKKPASSAHKNKTIHLYNLLESHIEFPVLKKKKKKLMRIMKSDKSIVSRAISQLCIALPQRPKHIDKGEAMGKDILPRTK